MGQPYCNYRWPSSLEATGDFLWTDGMGEDKTKQEEVD